MNGDCAEGQKRVHCGLTLEDEFTLTRIRNKAHSLKNRERDQFFWNIIYRLICRERGLIFSVMDDAGIAVDTNIDLFDDDVTSVEKFNIIYIASLI